MSTIKGKKGLTSRLFPDAGRIMTKQWQLHVEGLAFSFSCVSYFHEKWEEMVLEVSQVGDWCDRYICIDKFLCLTHPCVYLRWKKRLQINYKCNQSGFFLGNAGLSGWQKADTALLWLLRGAHICCSQYLQTQAWMAKDCFAFLLQLQICSALSLQQGGGGERGVCILQVNLSWVGGVLCADSGN